MTESPPTALDQFAAVLNTAFDSIVEHVATLENREKPTIIMMHVFPGSEAITQCIGSVNKWRIMLHHAAANNETFRTALLAAADDLQDDGGE